MKIPILSNALERRVDKLIEERSLAKFDEFMDYLADGGQSVAGVNVTQKTALNSTVVYACIRILSETLASLPLPVYKRLEPRGKERASRHPLYKILHDAPNPYMTAFTFKETLMAHVATWGNAYADIQWLGNGQVKELWPLRPDRMKEVKHNDQGKLVYIYTLPDGQDTVLGHERVFHVPGLGFDGYVGYSPITLARNAVGLSMATEEFGGRFFSNGARPGGVLRHPAKLSPTAKEGLEKSWAKMHQGLSNSQRVAILEEGMEYTQIGIPPNDAQFLETRKFQIQEIARIYRIPPHMLADLERATFSNIEHQSIDFVVHTIRPWLVRWEQAIKQKLINTRDRDNYFAEFLVDGLLRGDSESRNKAYSVGRQWGWLSANDVLEMENKNPIGEQGDIYITPMNMIPADKINEFQPKSTPPPERQLEQRQQPNIDAAKNRSIITARFELLIKDAFSRVVNRDVADVRRALKRKFKDTKDPTEFLEWLEEYYEKAPEWIERTMLPVYTSLAELIGEQAASEVGGSSELGSFVGDYTDKFATRYIAKSRSVIRKLIKDNSSNRYVDEADPAGAVSEQLDHWEETRADGDAPDEAVQVANAVAKYVYIAAGVTRLMWVALGSDPCEFCESLDGKIVGIEQNFAADGSNIEAGGRRLPINGNKGHAPIHKGCVCQILPSF